jgi:cytochrome c-type biogenesis protein CcmH
MSDEEAKTAEAEISRRNPDSAEGSKKEPVGTDSDTGATSGRGLAIALLGMIVPAAAVALYFYLGTPDEADFHAGQTALPADHPTGAMDQAVRGLVERLKEQPGDIDGWVLLGRSMMTQGKYEQAVEVLRHAREMAGDRGDLLAIYGESLVLAADGTVTAEAEQVFSEADRLSREPIARYYLGLAKDQAGKGREALDIWLALEADSPPDAVWMGPLREKIAETADRSGVDLAALAPNRTASVGPSKPAAANIATSQEVSTGEHRDLIRDMVAQLAERLEAEPNDVEGWLQLARSYKVLDDLPKAKEAVRRAAEVVPSKDPALQAKVADMARSLNTDVTMGE